MAQPHTIDELTRRSTAHLDEVRARLTDRFQDVPADQIREYTRAEADRLGDRPIQAFVPVLVERAVRDRLERHSGA